ncbi:MAG TPA: DHA2 family efflux MFS transporter permease subunit [Syntrophomonadaceae bacterium]|nr:DHA2 family efflux MFS transporter permease subunit [Syntrophomonadaceae bacterium]
MQVQNQNYVGINKWLALFVVVIGTFMAMLDSNIINIAIPNLMAVFSVSLQDIKWIITAYSLALAAIIPLTGFLGEIFGTKKLYIYALAMFTFGSLLCGFSWSNTSMIVFRIIQALGGGMIMPVGMSIIFQIFPMEERGTAMGFWGIASMAAPAIGPTLGGYIIQYMDWRMIFYVNVPIGILGVLLGSILLKSSPTKPFKSFDFIGFITSILGLVSLLYVLGEGSSIDWGDIKYPLLLAFGIFNLLIFVANELTIKDPMLDLRVLKIFNFSASQIVTSFNGMAFMGGIYVLPLFLQSIRGYSPMESGIILFPAAIASGIMMPLSGKLLNKLGVRKLTIPGLIIVAAASYQLSFLNMNTAKETITLIAMVRGLGLGICMMPVNTAGLNSVPMPLVGKASALSNTIRQVAQALSITIMTTLIQSKMDYSYAILSAQITVFNRTASEIIKHFPDSALSMISQSIHLQAYNDAMNYAIAIASFAVVGSIITVMFMRDTIIAKPKIQ